MKRKDVFNVHVMRARFRYCTNDKVYYQHDIYLRRPCHPVGSKYKNGHVYVTVAGHRINLRDVVWMLVRGDLPKSGVKHKSDDTSDNTIGNIVPRNPVEWVSFL